MPISMRRSGAVLAVLATAIWGPDDPEPVGASSSPDQLNPIAAVSTYTIDADHFRTAVARLLDKSQEVAELSREQRLRVMETLVGARLLALEAERRGLTGEKSVQLGLFDVARQALVDLTYQREVEEVVTISPEEVAAHYEVWGSGEEIEAGHILLRTREEAEVVLTELAAGANFGELAKERSQHAGSSTRRGSMGYLRKFLIPDRLRIHMWGKPVGAVNPEPIRTPMGFHVVKVLGRRYLTLEQQEKTIRNFLGRQKRAVLKRDLHQRLQEEYKYEWNGDTAERLIRQGPSASGDSVLAAWRGGRLTVGEYRRRASGPDASSTDASRVRKVAEGLADEDLILLSGRAREWDQLPGVRRRVEEARLALLGQALFRSLADAWTASDGEVRTFYEKHRESYRGARRVSIREILVEDQVTVDSLYSLIQGGADMGEIARRHSTRLETRDQGGLWEVDMNAPGSATVYRVSMAGEGLLEPRQLPTGGYSIIQVLEKGEGRVLGLEEVEEMARADMQTEAMDGLISRLRHEYGAQVVVDERALLEIR